MTDPDLITLFAEPLERLGWTYMITGGVASVIYGDPRFTRDIDIVLDIAAQDIASLASAFPASEFFVPPREALIEEAGRSGGGHFNVIHMDTALRADVYLAAGDPLHAWAFERRLRLQFGSNVVWIAPVEYVILRKLQYFAASGWNHHLRDTAMMLRVCAPQIDPDVLASWVERLGLHAQLESARNYPD